MRITPDVPQRPVWSFDTFTVYPYHGADKTIQSIVERLTSAVFSNWCYVGVWWDSNKKKGSGLMCGAAGAMTSSVGAASMSIMASGFDFGL